MPSPIATYSLLISLSPDKSPPFRRPGHTMNPMEQVSSVFKLSIRAIQSLFVPHGYQALPEEIPIEGLPEEGPKSVMDKIPPEIIGEILSHLRSDRSALNACSMISRMWYFETRRVTFKPLVIQSRHLRWPAEELEEVQPTLAGASNYARDIRICAKGENDYLSDAIELPRLSQFLKRFKQLEVLTLSSMTCRLGSKGGFCDWAHSRPTITLSNTKGVRLVYKDKYPAFDHMPFLLDWFPSLEEFEILKSEDSRLSMLHTTNPPQEAIYQLRLRYSQVPSTSKSTRDHPIVAGIISLVDPTPRFTARALALDFDTQDRTELRHLFWVLREFGRNIRELTIRMPCRPDQVTDDPKKFFFAKWEWDADLDFSVCRKLETFNLCLNLKYQPRSDQFLAGSWNHVLHILGLVTNANTQTLKNVNITIEAQRVLRQTRSLVKNHILGAMWTQTQAAISPLKDRLDGVTVGIFALDPALTSLTLTRFQQAYPGVSRANFQVLPEDTELTIRAI